MTKDIEEKTEDLNDFFDIKKIVESAINISENAFLVYKPKIITDYVMIYKEMYGEEEG